MKTEGKLLHPDRAVSDGSSRGRIAQEMTTPMRVQSLTPTIQMTIPESGQKVQIKSQKPTENEKESQEEREKEKRRMEHKNKSHSTQYFQKFHRFANAGFIVISEVTE
jgi:hypothetical protein